MYSVRVSFLIFLHKTKPYLMLNLHLPTVTGYLEKKNKHLPNAAEKSVYADLVVYNK